MIGSNLKTIARDQGVTTRGGKDSLLCGGPNKLLVTIGGPRGDYQNDEIVSHEDLMAIQRTVGCSDRKMLAINRCLAVILSQKKLQPGLVCALTSHNKTLKDLFTVSELSFISET